jgi:hypothetical protein
MLVLCARQATIEGQEDHSQDLWDHVVGRKRAGADVGCRTGLKKIGGAGKGGGVAYRVKGEAVAAGERLGRLLRWQDLPRSLGNLPGLKTGPPASANVQHQKTARRAGGLGT